MKIIITESQYRKIRFARRSNQFPTQFLKNTHTYKNPCEFPSFHHWIERLIDDVLHEWMNLEDIDYVTDLIQGDLWSELNSYYNQKCK
jgi:hypothetical protein